jgi:hypothetical protein
MRVPHKNSSTRIQNQADPVKLEFPGRKACGHSHHSLKLVSKSEKNHKNLMSGSQQNERFEKLLLEAVDESLSTLGDSAKQAIYFHLEKTFKVSKSEIPNKIEEFSNAIEKIFGVGARLLEIQMMQRLHEKSGHTVKYYPKTDNLSFIEYLRAHDNLPPENTRAISIIG